MVPVSIRNYVTSEKGDIRNILHVSNSMLVFKAHSVLTCVGEAVWANLCISHTPCLSKERRGSSRPAATYRMTDTG